MRFIKSLSTINYASRAQNIQPTFSILHMRFVKTLIPLILCLAAILVLRFWLSKKEHRLHGFSNSPLLLFSVFNTIIVAIIVLSYRASSEEIDQNWQPVCEGYTQGDTRDYIEEDEEYHSSDGYDGDNEDYSSDDEIFWQDEEYDDNLEMRIESFIAKVYEERRKERLREIVATSSDLAKQTAMKHNYPHLNLEIRSNTIASPNN